MTFNRRYAVAALLWMALIFWFSSQPDLPQASLAWVDLIFKKLAHAAAYGLLWWLWQRATGVGWLAFALTLLYAISDEWHQTFVPGRSGWWVDVVVDVAGALAVWRFSFRGAWGVKRET
ncbi:MAG: VanZ family protein [Caldilineales bacterium]|nr:VanZ family protein [Caldilineales bacterium]